MELKEFVTTVNELEEFIDVKDYVLYELLFYATTMEDNIDSKHFIDVINRKMAYYLKPNDYMSVHCRVNIYNRKVAHIYVFSKGHNQKCVNCSYPSTIFMKPYFNTLHNDEPISYDDKIYNLCDECCSIVFPEQFARI